jgi:Domain of unknown function (DUF5666)
MVRKLTGAALVLLVSALAYAGEGKAAAKEVTGTVKSVSGSEFAVKSGDKDMTFTVDSKETTVLAKGGTHKMDQLKADGKPAVISEFLSENQTVSVKYYEKDGRMIATKVHVRKP